MQTVVKQPEVAVAYYTVKDVMGILGCKQTKAQDIIRQLNDEMEAKGYMRYVLEHFAKAVLGDDYEAVYAVHTDREHMHGHLIWNSVSMTTGKKYNSPKGNWKNHLQPIEIIWR